MTLTDALTRVYRLADTVAEPSPDWGMRTPLGGADVVAMHPMVQWFAANDEWLIPLAIVVTAALAAIPKVRSAVAAAWRWAMMKVDRERALTEVAAMREDLHELVAIRQDLARLLKAVGENDGKSLHERIGTLEAEGRSLTERVTALEQAVYQERGDRER